LKLYEISSELISVHDAVETGEPSNEELIKRLDELSLNFETKVESICKFIRNLDAEEKALESEINRLKAKRDQRSKLIGKLRTYMASNMEAVGVDKVKGQLFTVSSYDSKPAVNVLNLSDVPNDFIIVCVESQVDKAAVLEHFKTTGEIPKGIDITQGKTLRIT
jgi:seryl-tRNA synthetase